MLSLRFLIFASGIASCPSQLIVTAAAETRRRAYSLVSPKAGLCVLKLWKIEDSISRSAAMAFYLLIAGFYSIVALLGLAELWLLSDLMIPILSLTLVLVCLLISLGFTAVVCSWHKLRWLSGIALLLLAAYIVVTGISSQHQLSGIPVPILCCLLFLAAIALLLPLQSKASALVWQVLAIATL